ncbi:MAG TPA: pyrroloquinoline quinone-dependent dehydrogenase [Verrucomicrobiales bacterium]|nr:pyrroloquinoline quinone-dependent dehydrogenase [Verrucomicrobiales bacterium]
MNQPAEWRSSPGLRFRGPSAAFVAFLATSFCWDACGQGEGWRDRRDNYVEWAIYRGDKKANQYSELDQIHAGNVGRLEKIWEYRHGDPQGPSMYSNPIVVDGLLYFTTPRVNAVALDAGSGEEVWVFESAAHHPDREEFRGRSRGLVYWEDESGERRRIFNFVKDRVYAIDALTGVLIKSFGDGGAIDLRQDLPVDPSRASIEVTTPGIVYQNFLIVGSRVPEGNQSTPGDIRAYDAVTGEFRWIFHTIPHEDEVGYDTWEWQEGSVYGGANPWGGFSLDEERGWVFCATGCAAGDFIYGGSRPGSNLFSNCVLALDAATGERQWHYQTIHHDIWDYDNPPAPILATIPWEGGSRDVAVQLTKMGLTFVLDRDTGEPLFPVEERPVAASDVPGESAWPTQPFPSKPPPLVRLATYEADLSWISPEAHAAALEMFRKHRTGPLYTPASLAGTITTPGHQGGVEWGGGAFDPETGILFVNANEAPTVHRLEPLGQADLPDATPVERGAALYLRNCTFCHGPDRAGNPPLYPPLRLLEHPPEDLRALLREGRGIMPAFAQLSTGQEDALIAYLLSDPAEADEAGAAVSIEPAGNAREYAQIAPFFADAQGVPLISPPWGTLNAVDLSKGEILWKAPLGEYPHLAARGIRHTGAKNFGGPVLTSTGLVFIAATPDEKIRAFDKYSGRVLWEHALPAAGYATPSTYQIAGRQFVVIAAGGGGKLGTRFGESIVAFALPVPGRGEADGRESDVR